MIILTCWVIVRLEAKKITIVFHTATLNHNQAFLVSYVATLGAFCMFSLSLLNLARLLGHARCVIHVLGRWLLLPLLLLLFSVFNRLSIRLSSVKREKKRGEVRFGLLLLPFLHATLMIWKWKVALTSRHLQSWLSFYETPAHQAPFIRLQS